MVWKTVAVGGLISLLWIIINLTTNSAAVAAAAAPGFPHMPGDEFFRPYPCRGRVPQYCSPRSPHPMRKPTP